MALAPKNQTLASDFVSLKARVKSEMLRRCHTGSLKGYAGTDYEYTVQPEKGGQLLSEHVNKIVVPINAIKPTGLEQVVVGDQALSIDYISEQLSNHENYPMRGSGTDCAGSCSGLCSSGCWNSCSGCGGSCSYSCSGGCDDTCSGGCDGSCGTSCWRDGCTSNCTAACRMDCTGGCSGCSATCRSCAGVCGYGCGYHCGGDCRGGANDTTNPGTGA